MAESVYKVIELVGTSTESWEKAAAVAVVIIWLRATFPRLREDQLQRFAWVGLTPLALALILVTSVYKVGV